jgi:hypothetical protein
MGRLKHSPSAPATGFRPIQLSRQEISRMQEESNRVVANMERNRQAEMQQRRDVLQTMKEDAAYTERAEQRNFEIQQQNLQVEYVQAQLDARTQEAQASINIRQTEQIFGGLAKFSESAGDIARQIEVKKEKRKLQEDYIKTVRGENQERGIDYKNAEAAMMQLGERYATTINIQSAEGGDPGARAVALAANPATTSMANKASATWMLKNQFPVWASTYLDDTETQFEFQGKLVTPASARSNPQLMSVMGQILVNKFLEEKNLVGLSSDFLYDGLVSAQDHIDSLAKLSSVNRTKDALAINVDQVRAIGVNAPEQFAERGVYIYRRLSDSLGHAGALDELEKMYTTRTADGTGFIFPEEAFGNLDLKANGKTFREEFPTRWAAMQEARVNAEMKYAQRQMQIDDIGFAQDERRILQGLTEDPSQGNADAAVKFFMEEHGKVPPSILKYQASYTTEAVDKAESAKRYLAIPSGLITLETVEGAESLDYELGREIRKRYAEQESRYNSGLYKETAEAFKTTANGITAYGTNKPNTPASVFLQTMMRSEFRKRVDQAVAGGMDFNQAATTIGQQLDAEVKAGARDPNSKWFRKTDAPGAGPSFPNLNKGMVSGVEAANRRYQQLKSNIATNGIERTIDTKGSIITAEEAQQIVQNYGKSSFTVPADVQAVAGMSNGLDPMVIINRQLVAQGMQPLQPPPSMQTTRQLVSPAFQRLLYKAPSPNRSARGLGTSNTFNAAIVPNNLGPVIQQAAQANGVNPAHIAALAEIESNFNPNAPSYNNSSFGVMQINRAAHPAFFAQQNWRDPQANINYGAQYYAGLLRQYGDPVAAAMAYNAGPGNYDAYLRGEMPDGRKKTEMINHGKKFAKAMYKYGGGGEALNNPALMRSGSAVGVSTPARDLRTFSPQVSSVTFDSGQPGIDVFFEDKQFPAVLPGIVKDVSFQGTGKSGYGNYIVIESTDPQTGEKVDILYSHLAARPNLNPGQAIRTGQIIGQQGGTGRVVSADGTIASIDFLRPAPRGSKDMTPYRNYDQLRRRIASQLRSS